MPRMSATVFALRCSARRTDIRAGIGDAGTMVLLVIGRIAAATAIVAASSVVTSSPAPAASDEDQVRAVLDKMNSSYNDANFVAFASHLCADLLRAPDYEAGWHNSRESDGPTQIAVNSVHVKGDDAVANVRFDAAEHDRTLDVDFLRQGAEWKACRYHAGQTV
jgi:hypothetical protein